MKFTLRIWFLAGDNTPDWSPQPKKPKITGKIECVFEEKSVARARDRALEHIKAGAHLWPLAYGTEFFSATLTCPSEEKPFKRKGGCLYLASRARWSYRNVHQASTITFWREYGEFGGD